MRTWRSRPRHSFCRLLSRSAICLPSSQRWLGLRIAPSGFRLGSCLQRIGRAGADLNCHISRTEFEQVWHRADLGLPPNCYFRRNIGRLAASVMPTRQIFRGPRPPSGSSTGLRPLTGVLPGRRGKRPHRGPAHNAVPTCAPDPNWRRRRFCTNVPEKSSGLPAWHRGVS